MPGYHRFEWTSQRADGSKFMSIVTLIMTKIDGKPYLFTTVADQSEAVETRKRREMALTSLTSQFDERIVSLLRP